MKPNLVLVAVVALGLAILGFGVAGGLFLGRLLPAPAPPTIAATPAIITQIQALSQWVTVKYVFEKVVQLDDVKWYGQNRLLMVAHGVVKAGVDLQRVTAADVTAHAGKLTLSLPKPQLLDVYLDEKRTEVIERSTGILREFDQQLEQDARRQAVDQIRLAARAAGILKDAEERTRLQMSALAQAAGYGEVTIQFR
jgi:hypothetical protein